MCAHKCKEKHPKSQIYFANGLALLPFWPKHALKCSCTLLPLGHLPMFGTKHFFTMSDVAAAVFWASAKPMAAQTETILEHINQGNQELATSVKADLKQVLREFSAIIDDRFKEHEKLMWAAFATYRQGQHQQQMDKVRKRDDDAPPMLPSRKFAADSVIPREVIDHFAAQSDRDPQRMQRASGAPLAPPLSHGGMEGDSIFPNAGAVAFTSVAAEATASHPLTVSRSVAERDPMFVSTTGTRRADSVEAKVRRSIKPSHRQQPPPSKSN